MNPIEQDPGGMPPEHPDLFALVRAELTNAEALAAGVHLDHCSECLSELAEVVVGNGLLTRAVRTQQSTGPNGAPGSAAERPALPPLVLPPRRRSLTRPALLVAAAAVVIALVGAVALRLVDRDDPAERTATPAYDAVQLDAVEGSAVGEARILAESDDQTRLIIKAPDLPGVRGGRFYYAWLLDPATNKMLPLGQVGPNGTASFDLDNTLLASYSAIDVSLEDDDGDPGHSVTSVLRGTYGSSPEPARS